jgi:hypothetical protein
VLFRKLCTGLNGPNQIWLLHFGGGNRLGRLLGVKLKRDPHAPLDLHLELSNSSYFKDTTLTLVMSFMQLKGLCCSGLLYRSPYNQRV